MVLTHADSLEGASMQGTTSEEITPSPLLESWDDAKELHAQCKSFR